MSAPARSRPVLSKSVRVLDELRWTPGPYTSPVFTQSDNSDTGSGQMHSLVLNRDDWECMGEPTSITVTIEPGDLLNVTGSA